MRILRDSNMPATPTIILDLISGTYTDSTDGWRDTSYNLVSMQDFQRSTVQIYLGYDTALNAEYLFNGVLLAGMTSEDAFTLTQANGSQLNFAEDARVGSADRDLFTLDGGTIATVGTVTFDGETALRNVFFNNYVFDLNAFGASSSGGTINRAVNVVFEQSDKTHRTATWHNVDLDGTATTDRFTGLDIDNSYIGGTLTVGGGGQFDNSELSGLLRLNGTDAFSAYLTSELISADGRAGSLVVLGDRAENRLEGAFDVTGRIDMGDGSDSVDLTGDVNGRIILGNGSDTLTLTGTVTTKIFGGRGADTINLFDATNAGISIHGGNGDDLIYGSSGNEVIVGDGGNDTISGGAGRDILVGRSGADVFVFAADDSTPEARDMIRDFSKADGDKIDLTFTANHFHDGNSFTGASGEVIAVGRLVQVDIDGDRVADIEIDMRSDLGLTADDFILTFGFEMV